MPVVHSEVQKDYDKLSYFHVLFTLRGFFAFVDIMCCCTMYNFCDTTLPDHFKKVYGYTSS